MGTEAATKVALKTNSLAFGWLDLEPTFAGQSEPPRGGQRPPQGPRAAGELRHALADAKSGMVL